jgi:hypothetical protein
MGYGDDPARAQRETRRDLVRSGFSDDRDLQHGESRKAGL